MTDDSLGQPNPTSCAAVTQTFTQAWLSAPFIIDGAVRQWPARDWTVDKLADALGEKTFRCRLMPLEREVKGVPAWEAEGLYVNCQLRQFNSWCQGEASQDNPLAPFSPLHFSAYIDYKYMTQVFAETPHMLGEVQWSTVGLDGLDGQNSTIWIGSTGASTPCHYDTYGFNLVAQIQGRKRWVLIPPGDSACMYPTRIPYEESSVFSQVDVTCPQLRTFPAFKKVQPIVITLEPGQVLYVPRHWWHYVTCTQTAISVNTWVDVPEDNVSRLHEALTRVLASSVIPYLAQTAGPAVEDAWINPTEELEGATVSVEYLKAALSSWQPVTCKPKSWQDSSRSGDKHPRHSAQEETTPAATARKEEPDKHADSNSSSSRKERQQEDCKKHSDSNNTLHQEDAIDPDEQADSNSSSSRKERQQEDCKKHSDSNNTLHQEDAIDPDEQADSNSSSSRKERQQEDCKKHSDSNNTLHQEDAIEPDSLQGQCPGSRHNSSPQPVTTDTRVTSDQTTDTRVTSDQTTDTRVTSDQTDTRVTSDQTTDTRVTSDRTESKRLSQLARALQCCPLQSVQSPFCLSERHNKSVDQTTSGTLRLGCGSVKYQTNMSADSFSRKRRHSDCKDDVASESKMSTEACLQRQTNFNQLDKAEDVRGTNKTKMLGTDGDSAAQSVRDAQSADLNMLVYVPKPCSLETYLLMLEHKDSTEDEYSKKDVEKKYVFLARETEKKTLRGLEKEDKMSHAEERAMCHDQKEGVAPYSNEKGNDSENVQDRSHGEDYGCLEEKLLRSVLHPDVVKLIVQKMVDQI